MTVKVDLDTHHVLLKFDLDRLCFLQGLQSYFTLPAQHMCITYRHMSHKHFLSNREHQYWPKNPIMDEALTGGAEATYSNNCLHKSKDNRVNTYRHVETVNHV